MIKKFSISSIIGWMLAGSCILLSLIFILTVKLESDEAALASARILFQEITDKTSAKLNQFIKPVNNMTRVMAATLGAGTDRTLVVGLYRNFNSFKAVLDANEQIMSAYLGYDDSSFYQVICVRNNPYILKTYDAPEGCCYIDRVISSHDTQDSSRKEIWRYFDSALKLQGTRSNTTAYDPRVRPWYGRAQISDSCIFTPPYVFSSSRLPGITCAHKLAAEDGVMGMDVSIAGLSDILSRQKVGNSGKIWIVDSAGRLIASPGTQWKAAGSDMLNFPGAADAADPAIRSVAVYTPKQGESSGQSSFFLNIDHCVYMASLSPVHEGTGLHLAIAAAVPVRDITSHISRMMIRILSISFVVLLFLILLSLYIGKKMARPVLALAREAEKIQQFDFSPSLPLSSNVAEVHSLGLAYSIMKETIQSKTEHLMRTQDRLKKLVEGGLALSAEKDLSRLVRLILKSAMDLAGADGGVMYLMDGEKLSVEFLAYENRVILLGALSENDAPRVMVNPAITQFLSRDSVLFHACEAYKQKEMKNDTGKNFSLFPTDTDCFPKNYAIKSLITAPIITRGESVLGVIQLFNPQNSDIQDAQDENAMTDLLASLVSQAAVGLDNRNLVNSLEELFNALIKVIASSIDAKSPYTGGHCTRVPKLTEMIALEVSKSDHESLKSFKLETTAQKRQLHIAAWLHDCGKVTTPEYVVDKATKLETIYDRIHEIRLRFEVLLRDARIDYLQKCLDGHDAEKLRSELDKQIRQLHEEFGFIAQCNIGGEFMSEDKKERVRQIAKRTWTRHFSDRAGIGPLALEQKQAVKEPELPVEEHLLMDSPDHLRPREKFYEHIMDIHGNPIHAPENEYNRGEVYNLCIERGTLTAEERFKINEHTLSGIEMLNQIPFPEDLAKVPDIATGHHETLIGTGYPLKKSLEHLSIESRILAVADIFEALTASDRPYKKAKTVSQALKIMSFMRNDRHIDPDIFDIFLTRGIFREYARDFLAPKQIDIEDISEFLSPTDKIKETQHGND